MSLVQVLWSLPTSQKLASIWVGVNGCVNACMHGALSWTDIRFKVYPCLLPRIPRIGSGSITFAMIMQLLKMNECYIQVFINYQSPTEHCIEMHFSSCSFSTAHLRNFVFWFEWVLVPINPNVLLLELRFFRAVTGGAAWLVEGLGLFRFIFLSSILQKSNIQY